jgi:hypothetical protein
MTATTDLRQMLIDHPTVGALVDGRIATGWIPQLFDLPYIWMARGAVDHAEVLDDAGDRPFREFVDLEAVADTEEEAEELAEAVREALADWNNNRATNGAVMGANTYTWLAATEQSDDYLARNAEAQDLVSIRSLQIEVTNP